jgi:hypothetical protein
MKKPMTLDDFADSIQKDYTALRKDYVAIHKDMAHVVTKENIKYIQAEMRTGFRDLNSDVKNITETMISKADLANTIAEELEKSSHGDRSRISKCECIQLKTSSE